MLRGVAISLALCSVACGGGARFAPSDPARASDARLPTPAGFEQTLARFAALDRTGWDRERCQAIARRFEAVAAGVPKAREAALYNAGLAYERCGLTDAARAVYQRASSHRARAKLVLIDHARGAPLNATIPRLAALVTESRFAHPDLLVALAALELRRGAPSDLAAARANVQRALAIDDAYMPALNLLATSYLMQARSQRASGLELAGGQRRSASRQMLDLAALVASQAIRKNDRYAEIHNTAGLIAVELSDYNAAVKSFERARVLDPRSFAAHMNYAAVSFALRGYEQAEAAYRAALTLDGESYEAHLGLALALRARAKPGSTELVAEARRHLERARRIAPERPEAYYNEALLVEELESKQADGAPAIAALRRARALYSEFTERAGSAHQDAVQRAAERSQDVAHKIEFLKSPR